MAATLINTTFQTWFYNGTDERRAQIYNEIPESFFSDSDLMIPGKDGHGAVPVPPGHWILHHEIFGYTVCSHTDFTKNFEGTYDV